MLIQLQFAKEKNLTHKIAFLLQHSKAVFSVSFGVHVYTHRLRPEKKVKRDFAT